MTHRHSEHIAMAEAARKQAEIENVSMSQAPRRGPTMKAKPNEAPTQP